MQNSLHIILFDLWILATLIKNIQNWNKMTASVWILRLRVKYQFDLHYIYISTSNKGIVTALSHSTYSGLSNTFIFIIYTAFIHRVLCLPASLPACSPVDNVFFFFFENAVHKVTHIQSVWCANNVQRSGPHTITQTHCSATVWHIRYYGIVAIA